MQVREHWTGAPAADRIIGRLFRRSDQADADERFQRSDPTAGHFLLQRRPLRPISGHSAGPHAAHRRPSAGSLAAIFPAGRRSPGPSQTSYAR